LPTFLMVPARNECLQDVPVHTSEQNLT